MDLNKLALITGGSSAALFLLAGILKLFKKSKGLSQPEASGETEEKSELTNT